jgi:hypothetical protein
MANGNEDASKFDPRTKWIPATVAVAACLFLFTGGRWFEKITTQSAATVPISTQLADLKTTVDEISGKMELVIGVRDDVLELQGKVTTMERRQSELYSAIETNRAYVNRLSSIMERAGLAVPPAPTYPSEPLPRRPP